MNDLFRFRCSDPSQSPTKKQSPPQPQWPSRQYGCVFDRHNRMGASCCGQRSSSHGSANLRKDNARVAELEVLQNRKE
jgi:hypothetical protein